MPESADATLCRLAYARASKHAKRNPNDPIAARRLEAARRAHLEARAIANLTASLDFVAALGLDDAGRGRVTAALVAA